jgi:hypothetical protein
MWHRHHPPPCGVIFAVGVAELRPLLAKHGCTVNPGIRLRTLAEVIDHLGATGRTGIVDGTAIRVRRPAADPQGPGELLAGPPSRTAPTEEPALVIPHCCERRLSEIPAWNAYRRSPCRSHWNPATRPPTIDLAVDAS